MSTLNFGSLIFKSVQNGTKMSLKTTIEMCYHFYKLHRANTILKCLHGVGSILKIHFNNICLLNFKGFMPLTINIKHFG